MKIDAPVLFITFDMSGYYTPVYRELQKRFSEVTFYNMAGMSYRYRNLFEKLYSFFYKITTGKKLKNFYKYRGLIEEVRGKKYHTVIIVRPDLLFDSQLQVLRETTPYFVAYYHDSINNIPRKKEVISFFDKVYSYEKKDVNEYGLDFLPNFIYAEAEEENPDAKLVAFSVMSNDYRVVTLRKLASYLQQKAVSYAFFVMDKDKKPDGLIHYFSERMDNETVLKKLQTCQVIVDVHKYGVQDGLTFRVFEALGFRKKLITTNADIKKYDFYNPNNIWVMDTTSAINIDDSFFSTPYQPVPEMVYQKYILSTWLDQLLQR